MVCESPYAHWIEEQAALINADGCTGVSNAFAGCCLRHDLEFYYGRSATDAYIQARYGERDPWVWAERLTFEEANAHFRACHFRESRLGYLNLVGWYRYAIVRRSKGRAAWEKHRAREREAQMVAQAVVVTRKLSDVTGD